MTLSRTRRTFTKFVLLFALTLLGSTVPISESHAFQYWCQPKTIGAADFLWYKPLGFLPSTVDHWMEWSKGSAEVTHAAYPAGTYYYEVFIELHYIGHLNSNNKPHGRPDLWISTNFYLECRGANLAADYSRKSNCPTPPNNSIEWWGVLWLPSYALDLQSSTNRWITGGPGDPDLKVRVTFDAARSPQGVIPTSPVVLQDIADITARTAAIFDDFLNTPPAGYAFDHRPIVSPPPAPQLPPHYQHLSYCDISENVGGTGPCICTHANAGCP